MSDGREQSYYEIALTNRQVMSIFVVLLVCLLVAFVSGIWIGREGSAGAVQTAAAQSISAGVDEGEQPLGEMDFFGASTPAGSESDQPSEGPSGEEAPEGVQRASTSEPKRERGQADTADVASQEVEKPRRLERNTAKRRQATGEALPGRSDSSTRGQTQPTASENRPSPSTPRAPASEPDTKSNEPERAAANAAGQAAESIETSGEFFFIQVFSSNDEVQARSVVGRLRGGSYPAILSSADIEGRAMYRVRIGPYSDRGRAQEVAQRVQRDYKLSTWITR